MIYLNETTALSTFDSLYADILSPLRTLFSEYGLFYYRIFIEIEWLKILLDTQHIPIELKFTEKRLLEKVIDHVSPDAFQQLTRTHKNETHQIFEFLKTNFSKPDRDVSLPTALIEKYMHFQCSLDDVDQLAYCLILDDFQKKYLMAKIDAVQNIIRKFALQLKQSTKNKKHARAVQLLSLYIAPLERQQRTMDAANFQLSYQGNIDHSDQSIKAAWIQNFSKKFQVTIMENHKKDVLKKSFEKYAQYIIDFNKILMDFSHKIAKSIETKLMNDAHETGKIYDEAIIHFELSNTIFDLFIHKKLFYAKKSKMLDKIEFFEYIGKGVLHAFVAYELFIHFINQLMTSGFDALILESKFEASLWEKESKMPEETAPPTPSKEFELLLLDAELMIKAVIERLNLEFNEAQCQKAIQNFLHYADQKKRSWESDINAAFLSVITVYVASMTLPHHLITEDPFGIASLKSDVKLETVHLQKLSAQKAMTEKILYAIKHARLPADTQKYFKQLGITPTEPRLHLGAPH
ncbi:MAG: hypothetical protein JW855_05140 [Gammaproteobacteria bacterium]|nr:hypothetical protein [Gammaproteobacteria bacterium]